MYSKKTTKKGASLVGKLSTQFFGEFRACKVYEFWGTAKIHL
jgi:hypothetical protein